MMDFESSDDLDRMQIYQARNMNKLIHEDSFQTNKYSIGMQQISKENLAKMRCKAAEENVMFRFSINIMTNQNDEFNQKATFFS